MSQAEINGLLSLPGQISRLVASDRGNGTLQSEVARFVDTQLSNQVMGGLQNAVADALQLDEFRLGTGFSEQNLHVQIGKYLVDNLYMTYSRTFSTDPLETLRFEYRLQPGLLVNTSFDNRGEVRMGVEAKHRF
jgi:autotransporter translocation and assembly factor TamB